LTFSISITPIRHNLETISLDMPYSFETVISELEKEDWKSSSHDFSNSKRHLVINPESVILKQIKEFLTSDAVKKQIIDSFYDNFPNIRDTWNGWTQDQMFERTVWDGFFVKDLPGYSMSKHLDSRTNVGTAIVYLNNSADQRRTTKFFTDKHGSDEIKIDNNFAQGVVSINDSDTWHEVENGTDTPRYTIILILLLLIDFYDPKIHSGMFDPAPKITL